MLDAFALKNGLLFSPNEVNKARWEKMRLIKNNNKNK